MESTYNQITKFQDTLFLNTTPRKGPNAREGVIIECPLNDLFHDVVTVILTSCMGVSEMVVNVGNTYTLKRTLFDGKMTEK